VPDAPLVKLAISASRETIEVMLKSARVRALSAVLQTLKSNPYLKKEEAEELRRLVTTAAPPVPPQPAPSALETVQATAEGDESEPSPAVDATEDEAISTYLQEHAEDIAAEGDKPFHPIGGIVDLLGSEYFPVTQTAQAPAAVGPDAPAVPPPKPQPPVEVKRENALQKISHLNVQGRIQLALKGNKEERALLIRDGTKIVAFAVLEAPKLSDGEVEKFASQKNVLEAVLRQIPLKRKFMKNYKVVRNLVGNPRTPLDLGLTLMKNILPVDLKNIAANKDVSETIRNLAMKMYKQKIEASNKK
jgi:hypothetical protein